MNLLKTCTLTILFSTFTFTQNSLAAVFPPPISEQVMQIARWFSGRFDNSEQVTNEPNVPLITMANCSIQLQGGNFGSDTETLYLEQRTGSNVLRSRLYTFSPSSNGVNLNIYRFFNQNSVLETCNNRSTERIIDFANINFQSNCNVMFSLLPNRSYTGDNAPNGCPVSFPIGSYAVSEVEIARREIDSFDRIFDANGNLVFGTPIEFRQINIPEPSLMLGLLFFGVLGIGVRRKKD